MSLITLCEKDLDICTVRSQIPIKDSFLSQNKKEEKDKKKLRNNLPFFLCKFTRKYHFSQYFKKSHKHQIVCQIVSKVLWVSEFHRQGSMSVYLINCLMFDFKIFKNRKQFSCNNVLILLNTEMPQDPFLLIKQHLHLVIVPTMTNYTNDNLALFFRMPYFHHFVADSMASMNNRYCAQGNNNSKCSCFFKSLFFWQFFFKYVPSCYGRSLKKYGKVDTEKWRSLISFFHF